MIGARHFDIAMGHDLHANLAVDIATSLDPRAHRLLRSLGAPTDALRAWSPQCRYESTGTRPEADAQELVRDARGWVDAAVLELLIDASLNVDHLA